MARSNCAESVSITLWIILKLRSFELSGNVQDACTTLRSIKDIAHKPGVVSHYTFFAFPQIRQNASLLLQDNHRCLDIKSRDASETVATQINNNNKQKADPKPFEHNFYFMVSWLKNKQARGDLVKMVKKTLGFPPRWSCCSLSWWFLSNKPTHTVCQVQLTCFVLL